MVVLKYVEYDLDVHEKIRVATLNKQLECYMIRTQRIAYCTRVVALMVPLDITQSEGVFIVDF